jgi:membrane protein DedA with SNARE-associated domain
MLKKLKTPIILICIFLSLILIWKLLKLPPDDVLIEMVHEYFMKYGLLTVLVASIIEGMLLVGVYLPGGMVIFLGVLTSLGDPRRATLSVIMTILGLGLAYIFNYFLGKHGWYKILVKFGMRQSLHDAEVNLQKHNQRAIYMSYWQPNLASFVSTASGILKTDFKKFALHSTLATILWCAFWGITAYFLGEKVLTYLGPIFFAVMLIWIGSIIWGHYKSSKS